jgi:hypothetical protein
MVKSVPKQKKVLKVSKEKVQTSSSSSTSSSLSSLAPSSVFQCSPPLQSNGAKVAKVPLLNSDEQKMYTKHSSEIKQITALIILKSGLCLAERPSMSQIHQEHHLFEDYEKVYRQLCQDVIIGKRVSAIPLKFVNISTSKADEVMSGYGIRKKYSTFKSYINNTLTVIWRK